MMGRKMKYCQEMKDMTFRNSYCYELTEMTRRVTLITCSINLYFAYLRFNKSD